MRRLCDIKDMIKPDVMVYFKIQLWPRNNNKRSQNKLAEIYFNCVLQANGEPL